MIRRSKTDQEAEGSVQFLGKPTAARIRAWLRASGGGRGAVPRRHQVGAGVWRAPDDPNHPNDHHPAGQGGGGGRTGQRPQPAGRQRAEPGYRRRLAGRDAGCRAVGVTEHAGVLRARATGETRCRGKTAVRHELDAARSPRSLSPLSRRSPVRGAELGMGVVAPCHRAQGQPSGSGRHEKTPAGISRRGCLLTSQPRNTR